MRFGKKEILIGGSAIIIALNVFGLRYPYSVGLFLPLTLLLGLVFLLTKGKILFPRLIWPFIVICLSYLLSFLIFRDSFQGVVRRDITNMVSLSLLAYLLFAFIQSRDELDRFYHWTGWGIIIVTFLTSIISLVKFHYLMKSQLLSAFDFPPDDYPWGTSLVTDYNYFALGGIAGLLACILFYRRYKQTGVRISLVVFGWFIAISILLSGSRRGLMILALVLGILLFYITFRYLKRTLCWQTQMIAGLALFVSLLYAIVVSHYAVKMPIEEKRKLAVQLGYDQLEMPRAFARLTYRYATIIKPHIDKEDVYIYFLPPEFWSEEASKKTLYEKRSEKWTFAIHTFQSYPIVNKVFGNGFSYVSSFGEKFVKEEKAEDYPHNYLLSALLYAGIIGVIVLLLYMIFATWLYFKYLYRYPLFAILFMISQSFAITSGNSIFSEKFTCLLGILPFLIYSVHSKFDLQITDNE